jgi:hypothetical protein
VNYSQFNYKAKRILIVAALFFANHAVPASGIMLAAAGLITQNIAGAGSCYAL